MIHHLGAMQLPYGINKDYTVTFVLSISIGQYSDRTPEIKIFDGLHLYCTLSVNPSSTDRTNLLKDKEFIVKDFSNDANKIDGIHVVEKAILSSGVLENTGKTDNNNQIWRIIKWEIK